MVSMVTTEDEGQILDSFIVSTIFTVKCISAKHYTGIWFVIVAIKMLCDFVSRNIYAQSSVSAHNSTVEYGL